MVAVAVPFGRIRRRGRRGVLHMGGPPIDWGKTLRGDGDADESGWTPGRGRDGEYGGRGAWRLSGRGVEAWACGPPWLSVVKRKGEE